MVREGTASHIQGLLSPPQFISTCVLTASTQHLVVLALHAHPLPWGPGLLLASGRVPHGPLLHCPPGWLVTPLIALHALLHNRYLLTIHPGLLHEGRGFPLGHCWTPTPGVASSKKCLPTRSVNKQNIYRIMDFIPENKRLFNVSRVREYNFSKLNVCFSNFPNIFSIRLLEKARWSFWPTQYKHLRCFRT